MSINTQKKILYIPLINFIIVFCFLRSCFVHTIKMAWFFKKVIIMVIAISIITLLRVGLTSLIHNDVINSIVFLVDVYLNFFVMSKVSLDAQIELETKSEH